MDPLTALALAGNIIQFVDFGITLLSGVTQLYKSPTGSLEVHDEIELITTDLKSLVTKLRGTCFSGTLSNQPDSDVTCPHTSFRRICDGAIEVAEELLEKLSTLKVPNGSHGILKSIRQAVKICWKEKEVEALRKRLKNFKEALETEALFSLRQTLDNHAIFSSARFEHLEIQTQRIAKALLEPDMRSTSKISHNLSVQMNAQMLAFTQLMSRLESINRDDHRRTRAILMERLRRESLDSESSHSPANWQTLFAEPSEIISDVEMLDVSDTTESTLRASVADRILGSLRYPKMTSRYEDVIEAHPKTFEWAFKDSAEDQCEWSSLPRWLQDDHGVYWISGKAGSGKSTLMRHIVDDPRTINLLKAWAGSVTLITPTFFFWNSGNKEQRSQCGLLRSLIFQILSQQRELIPIVAPNMWARYYSGSIGNGGSLGDIQWNLRELMGMFQAILDQEVFDLRICLFVDGLDEFDGDHDEISTLFKNIGACQGIKVCLSSRPWVVFEDLFVDCPRLRLQDLTYPDIKRYVSDKMRGNTAFQRLEMEEPVQAPALIEEIVEKAKGVFVWVRLAVQSLLNGIRNQDDLSDLWTRLRLLPEEIKPLYSRLLDLIEPVYIPWASRAFQIVRHVHDLSTDPFQTYSWQKDGVQPLSTAGFLLAMHPNFNQTELDEPSGHDFVRKCKRVEVQLKARSAGLLETSKDGCVQYFHRTVKDFLEQRAFSTAGTKTFADSANFILDLDVTLMKSCFGCHRIELAESQGGPFHNKRIDSLIHDFMTYAYHADIEGEGQQCQIDLINKLSNVMAKLSTIQGSGFSYWMVEFLPHTSDPDFLHLATIYGLRAYVESKLQQFDSSETKSIATRLLQQLLPEDNRHVQCRLPLPRLEMVSLLLDYGADALDMNVICPSPWQNLVNYTTRVSKTSQEISFDYDSLTLHRRYLEIMKLLVPNEDLQEKSKSQGKAFSNDYTSGSNAANGKSPDIIENFLAETFPNEAAAVMANLRSLETEELGPSRKRPREFGQDIGDWQWTPKRLKIRPAG